MASFQAKIGWKRLRKRENKNLRSVSFLLDAKQKIPKKQQKIEKIKKYQYGVFSSQNSQGKSREREKIKIFVPFHSVPTRRIIENSKKIAKKFNKLKNIIMASFQAKIGWKRLRKRENKNCRFVPFRSCPTGNRKFQKNSKKLKNFKNSNMASFQAKIHRGRQRKRENKNCHSVPLCSYTTRNRKFQKKATKFNA